MDPRAGKPPDAPRKAQSVVHRAAGRLRAMALATAEGRLLGSEDELMAHLSVSRPTLRQAAALVAQDQLIRIRRGVNGGYFATSPDSMTVARMAALYLRSRKADLGAVIQAVDPIRSELARMASRNRAPEARRLLEQFLEQERALDGALPDYRSFLRGERAFGSVLGTISGNAVLALFLAIIYDLSALLGEDQDVYIHHPQRVEAYRAQRNRMAAAILEGDEELAVIATKRCTAIVTAWMAEDLGERGFESGMIEEF